MRTCVFAVFILSSFLSGCIGFIGPGGGGWHGGGGGYYHHHDWR
jgi:hypothetical protein